MSVWLWGPLPASIGTEGRQARVDFCPSHTMIYLRCKRKGRHDLTPVCLEIPDAPRRFLMTEVWWGLKWTCPKYGCQIQGLLLCVLRRPLCPRSGLCAPEASVWGTMILCWTSWVMGQFGQAPPPRSSTGETLQWRIDTWKLEGHCHPEEMTMPAPLCWSLIFIAAEAREAS